MCIAGHFFCYQIFATPQNTPQNTPPFPPKSLSFHSFSPPFFSFQFQGLKLAVVQTTFSQTWYSKWLVKHSKYRPQIYVSPPKKSTNSSFSAPLPHARSGCDIVKGEWQHFASFFSWKKSRASAPRSLGCDHREHSVLEKWFQGNKPLENVKYNQQHRPKSGHKENFRKGEAQRMFQHLVFSTWLCKDTQKENEFCAAFWFWCLHFLSLDILSLDILLLLYCNFI